MVGVPHPLLHEAPLSLNLDKLAHVLVNIQNLLVIQDLDGVCMGLVRDPLHRMIDRDYVKAAALLSPHFYVLTNGEHQGMRGVNQIIQRCMGSDVLLKRQGQYLPGLAAGGVQWQDRFGHVSLPGVSDRELDFLRALPAQMMAFLRQFFERSPEQTDALCDPVTLEHCIASAVLDNVASPTVNLNGFYTLLSDRPDEFIQLQQSVQAFLKQCLQEAHAQGLGNSFFIHYAPNDGRTADGQERLRLATDQDAGTTDFQFMLQGAVKEAGVPVILNHYYYQRTGNYPLGAGFNARQAPTQPDELLSLIRDHFDPLLMPVMVGVGDTVNSQVNCHGDRLQVYRGGSDRNFLHLIQAIGHRFNRGNVVVYVDSSHGEVKNRRSVKVGMVQDQGSDRPQVIEGPCDPRDLDDPLQLDVVCVGGHKQYIDLFCRSVQARCWKQLRQEAIAPSSYWPWVEE